MAVHGYTQLYMAIHSYSHESDSDQMLSLHGYTIVRRDRNKRGGGLCAYLRDSISFKRLHEFEDENLELITLEIQKPNSTPFLFTA